MRQLGEYKGKQDLFKQHYPQVLETLRQVAIIQSTESSNRIEGITASPERIKQIVVETALPRDRSEQEIAGYRDVLNAIHADHRNMRLSVDFVLQMHRDIYRFSPEQGGRWKQADNQITQFLPDGTPIVRFTPVSADKTPEAMQDLHRQYDALSADDAVDPLLLAASYILDFLCIHPFRDGNGRISRLLTLLLLYQAGYEVGRYISLEQLVEKTKDTYYETLYRSSQGWHGGLHDLLPWWEYLTGVLLAAYQDLAGRTSVIESKRGVKRQMILDIIRRLPERFKIGDIVRASPGVSRPTVIRVLAELRRNGKIRCAKAGRDAEWTKL